MRSAHDRIRIYGIDAPELNQTCKDEHGRNWPCGRAAHQRLVALVVGGAECSARGRDRYDRVLAICASSQSVDVGRTLVREGLAVEYSRPGRYTLEELRARYEKRGLWRGEFESPQQWRRRSAAQQN